MQDLARRLLEAERIDAQHRARAGLLNFTTYTMPGFEVSWHHRVVCRVLNRVVRGEIKRLILAEPPRHTKSELVTRRMPALLLGLNPDIQVVCASYGDTLAKKMNRDCQRIIMGERYKELFPGTTLNEKNVVSDSKGAWVRNSTKFEVVGRRGYYLCAGIGGPLTGEGADCAIVDDPVKDRKAADSPTIRESTWDWYTSVLRTRLSRDAAIVVTATRWHEDDLTGRLIEMAEADPDADQWYVLSLPAINEDGPSEHDPRQVGEALWPDRFPVENLRKIQAGSERDWLSLYQQRPRPPKGLIVDDSWWRFYDEPPESFDREALSADLTFKDKEKGNWCVFQRWGCLGADRYLLHQVRAQVAYTAQRDLLRQLATAHPLARDKFVEDAANGAALINDLRSEIQGLIAVGVKDSKIARAEACAPQIRAGNVYLPNPRKVPWVKGFIAEWAAFPRGKHDDQVDATTLALLQLERPYWMGVVPGGSTKASYWNGARGE